jgi:hypothetical protein
MSFKNYGILCVARVLVISVWSYGQWGILAYYIMGKLMRKAQKETLIKLHNVMALPVLLLGYECWT